jgi:hypothetical protein
MAELEHFHVLLSPVITGYTGWWGPLKLRLGMLRGWVSLAHAAARDSDHNLVAHLT